MNILLVEDDARVADFLRRGLRADGHVVMHVADGAHGLEAAREGQFAVIILDNMLPGLPGMEVCRQLRADGNKVPVLMLSALNHLDDRISGLRMGADDYLTKPFSFDELLARVDALARRVRDFTEMPPLLTVGDITFDREGLCARRGEEAIDLTARELAILELLMNAPGKIISRSRLLANVWGYDMDPLTNVLDVYIGRLRKKIEAAGSRMRIETVRGFGYRLSARADE